MIDSIFNEIKPNNYIGEIKEVDRDEIYNIKLSKTPLLEVINEDYGEYSNSNRNSKVYEGNIIKVVSNAEGINKYENKNITIENENNHESENEKETEIITNNQVDNTNKVLKKSFKDKLMKIKQLPKESQQISTIENKEVKKDLNMDNSKKEQLFPTQAPCPEINENKDHKKLKFKELIRLAERHSISKFY